MGRRLRLSVHRKNEFRKKRARRRGYSVAVLPLLTVSISLQKVALLEQQIPVPQRQTSVSSSHIAEHFTLRLSLPRNLCEQAPISSLNDLLRRLRILPVIPEGWINVTPVPVNSVSFLKLDANEAGDFQLSLSIKANEDRSWEVSVVGAKLQSASFLMLPQKIDSLSDLKNILNVINCSLVCCGNDDLKYEELVSVRKGTFMDQSGTKKVAFYNSDRRTIQCDDCQLLIPQSEEPVKRCGSCEEYRQVLNRMLYRKSIPGKDKDKTASNSRTNYRYLSTPEKAQRMKQLHTVAKVVKQQVSRLHERIEKMIEVRGTVVDDDLHKHLSDITEETSNDISQLHPEGSFARTFWDAQRKALSLKKLSSMRWDPIMIRWCIYLRHLSGSSAYEMLRESGAIKLPSQRTLRDYTYYTKAKSGFSDEIDEQLMEAANIHTCKERDKYVVLLIDEMHIREDIVYDKHSGAITGFTNLGEVNEHLMALEKQAGNEVDRTHSEEPSLANSMLVLLVKGLFSKLAFPYAQFPCTALSGELMYDPVWEAVSRLELCGFKVLALICDGLAANRRLFRLHNPDAGPSDVVYKVSNPYCDDGRSLFFLADPPHLMKTIRNAWYNSKRHLWCNGKDISWSHLVKLYHLNRSSQAPGLAMIPKLKYEHICLTNYSKMRVDLAAQVLSSSVANGIKVTQGAEAEETARFAEQFDKFFDCLNVSNSFVGKQSRKVFKNPYRSATDFRLKWLEELLGYLDSWEASVREREGYKDAKAVQNMMLLPLETRQGIQITVKSFVEMVKYIFTIPEVDIFYSNKLCQDSLENFFGQQRQRGRTHENPNTSQFLKNTQALRVINSTCATIRGNCRGSKSKDTRQSSLEIENNAPLRKRKTKSKKSES